MDRGGKERVEKRTLVCSRAVDLHPFFVDPDPGVFPITDPDPAAF